MTTQLLNNETKTGQVFLNNDVLTLTDKRLIYSNNTSSNDVFIGLNELRSINVNTTNVTYTGSKIKLGQWFFIIAFVIDLGYGVYTSNSIHQYGSDFMMGSIMGMFLFSPVAAIISGVIVLIINAYINGTKTVIKRAQVIVTKTDNSYFLKMEFDIDKLNELKTFEMEVNNLIYK